MKGIGKLAEALEAIDHLAVAVTDLEAAVAFCRDLLGFEEGERRVTQGRKTGMESVVMKAGSLQVVLLKGTTEESQVSRFVAEFGPGVQHAAFRVTGIEAVVDDLKARGLAFDTPILEVPGLKQAFTRRDPVTGLMLEIIERTGEAGFSDDNVRKLFESLEDKESF